MIFSSFFNSHHRGLLSLFSRHLYKRQQRREYERRLKITEGAAQAVAREAEGDAERAYDKLSAAARKKVQAQ